MHTIYTEGGRNLLHPRYVTNVSDQDVTVTYSSDAYTIKPGETILTDLNIANIFENYGVVREHDERTARVVSETRILVVSLADPTTAKQAERRQAPKVVIKDLPVDPLRAELEELNIGQLQSRARSLGLKTDPKAKKTELVTAIHKEESELAAETVELE